ncbi:unnamed protein product, partial [Tetraodon nigroviridis]
PAPAQGPARLSELLSSLPWASAGNKSTSWICISSVSHHCEVHSTAKIGFFFLFSYFPQKLCVI